MLVLVLRALLLATLLVSGLVRANAFSLFYLVCFFVGTALIWKPAKLQDADHSGHPPHGPSANADPQPRWSLHDEGGASTERPSYVLTEAASRPHPDHRFRRFLLFVSLSSFAILCAVAVFHIVDAAAPFDDSSNWWAAIGLQQSSAATASSLALLFVPDLVVFLVSTAVLLAFSWYHSPASRALSPTAAAPPEAAVPAATAHRRFSFLSAGSGAALPTRAPMLAESPATPAAAAEGAGAGWVWLRLDTHYALLHFVSFVLLLFAGIVDLSVLSFVYYAVWIVILALWALIRPDPSPALPPSLSRSPSASSPQSAVEMSPTAVSALRRGVTQSALSRSTVDFIPHGLSLSDNRTLSGSLVQPPSMPPTRQTSLSLHPIPDGEEKEAEDDDDDGDSVATHAEQDERDDSKVDREPPVDTHSDAFLPPPALDLVRTSSADGPIPSPRSPHHVEVTSSSAFTVRRVQLFYHVLSVYVALDFVARYVYRILFHYDGSSSTLAHVGFYTGVEEASVTVGLGAEYGLLLATFIWAQTVANFHDRYVCLPLFLFPSLRPVTSPVTSADGSPQYSPNQSTRPSPHLSPLRPYPMYTPSIVHKATSTTQSPVPAAHFSPHSPLSSLRAYTPPPVYYRLARFVIAYSFILVPVVTFCLALFYDILPGVVFLGLMTLSLLLPSPLSLLLAPVTLGALALFNLTLYALYLPSPYWSLLLSSFSVVNHPWWSSTPFALLAVTSAAMMYTAFVIKYKVSVFDRWADLLVWRDVERERREEQRQLQKRAAQEQRVKKAALQREAQHQRALREAQALQEEEDWEVEWARLSADGQQDEGLAKKTRRKKQQRRWWSQYTSPVGRLKLRFALSALLRSTASSAVASAVFVSRLLYRNADVFAIILLYIVGVLETDILHSIAILLFIVYAISHTARQSPALLVMYSSVAIILLFIFQFTPLSSDVSGPVEARLGFIGFGAGYQRLWPFLGLLIFGSIFFWRNPYSDRFRRLRGMHSVESDRPAHVHESVVLAGLVLCEVVMLWAGCANSLQSLTSLSISVISGMYFLLAFALLLNHQLALVHRYAYDRLILYVTATYAGCVIIVSYLYQLHAFDDYSDWLEYAGLAQGDTWRVLLTHSVVLFVCAFELRVMQRAMLTTGLFAHVHHTHREGLAIASASWQRSLLHVGFLLFLLVYWIVLLHTDKFLVITLFLAATRYVSVMGAWYIVCAFVILLVPGLVWIKSTVVMVSAMLFVLAIFVAQVPLAAFGEEHNVFTLLGLRVNTEDFGVLVVEHLAVVLMARLYMTSDVWLQQWKTEHEEARTAVLAAVVPAAAMADDSSSATPSFMASVPTSPTAHGARIDDTAVTVKAHKRGRSAANVPITDDEIAYLRRHSLQGCSQEEKADQAHIIDLPVDSEPLTTDVPALSIPAEGAVQSPSVSSPSQAQSTVESSSWVVWLYRGVFVDSSSFFHYAMHLMHYYSFYHLTLIACMIAAYDNASTVFGLAFTALAGCILVTGQRRVDRYWGWLVLAGVVEVVIKYSLSVTNLQEGYSCAANCSKWQSYWAHDDHLHDWDVVVLIFAGVHYAQLQQQVKTSGDGNVDEPPAVAAFEKDKDNGTTAAAPEDEEEKVHAAREDSLWAQLHPPSAESPEEAERRRRLYVPCPPRCVEVSYFRYDQSVQVYHVHDFTRRLHSSSAACHYLVFRCLLYLVLFLLLSVTSCYFNVIASLYLLVELGLLYLGDTLLERPECIRLLRLFQFLVYAVYLLRFLYLIPVFDIATTATAWSTVLGFYHVHETARLPPYAVSGVVGGVLYIDIIMMVLLEVQRTVLARPEMVFVRCELARNRLTGELRRATEEKKWRERKEAKLRCLQDEQRQRLLRLHQVQLARLALLPDDLSAAKPLSTLSRAASLAAEAGTGGQPRRCQCTAGTAATAAQEGGHVELHSSSGTKGDHPHSGRSPSGGCFGGRRL